jgi:endoglucanase
LRGTNLSGLEFGGATPGKFNKDYTEPTQTEIDYFTGKGMNIFRLPFLWERVQPELNGPLNDTYLGYIQNFVSNANAKGAYVLLDVHNYARYHGKVIGQAGSGVTSANFADLWSKLATAFKNNARVLFGIMNEPHGMTTELWLADANAAIAAIRSAGATQTITVPGNGWTGAWAWTSNGYGTPNSVVMLGVKDPLNNFLFEVHQYMDSDGSGTHNTCVNATIGSHRLEVFTVWARQHGFKALLGEWAGSNDATCMSAISDMANYMNKNKDVYNAWTWWSAGPWWGSYMFSIEPQCGVVEAPQLTNLQPYLKC